MKLKSIAHLCSSILLGFMASAGNSQEQLSAAPAVEAIGTETTQAAMAPPVMDDPTATLPNAKAGECYAKVILPAQYKTDRVEVVEREASEKIEVIPAKYAWVEEKVLVKEATFKLETVPAVYADVEERIEVSPAYTVWTTGDNPVSKPANPSLVASARAGGVPIDQATPGQCFVEHYQSAQFRTEKQKVMKKEASEKVVVSDPQYEWIEEKVLVKEASSKVTEVPAEYAEVQEQVLISPATTVWKKGRGLAEKIDNTTGEIMCLVEVPAQYKTVTRRVLKRPASTKVIEVPAEYAVQRVRKLTQSASEQRIPIPAEYVEVEKRMKVSDEKVGWFPQSAENAFGEPTGRALCLKEVPAEYKSVMKKLVRVPPSSRKVEIPAEYQVVKKRKLTAPPRELRIPVPAQKRSIHKQVKVADERLEWRQVLCETNMSEGIISQLQRSLKTQGYDPGPIDGSVGRQTMEAVEQYQLKKGLERGGLTLATLKSLGVKI